MLIGNTHIHETDETRRCAPANISSVHGLKKSIHEVACDKCASLQSEPETSKKDTNIDFVIRSRIIKLTQTSFYKKHILKNNVHHVWAACWVSDGESIKF